MKKGEVMEFISLLKKLGLFIVVLTGGPCAGKTEIINHLKRSFGKKVLIIEEVASLLLATGRYPMPNPWSQEWQDGFQSLIISEQLRLETEAISKASSCGAKTVVCDRGLLDGAAYLTGGLSEFCERFGVIEDQALSRYETVIHLESLSTLNPELYLQLMATNPSRFEPLKLARQREFSLRKVWEGHANRIHLADRISVNADKIATIVECLLYKRRSLQ